MRLWRFAIVTVIGFLFVLHIEAKISNFKSSNEDEGQSVEDILKKEEAEDAKYPEHIRKKRQVSRTSFQQYLANMAKGDYDVRYEEGQFENNLFSK